MKYTSERADGVCLFIAGTSLGSSLWKAPSRVCWTQQEDFHGYHCHLDQAQNNKARLCLADYIHEVPRKELWLLVFGQAESRIPSQWRSPSHGHCQAHTAQPPGPRHRQPTLIRVQLFKDSIVNVLQLTFVLVSASAGFFVSPAIGLLKFECL